MSDRGFKKIEKQDAEHFEALLGSDNIYLDSESLRRYGSDETEDISILPEIVLRPSSTEEVSAILKYAFENNIAVTPRGAGTGLSGGSIPAHGGISLSVERMNSILEIDERNFQVTTQPGVITQVLQEAVEEKSLFYPPDPASKGSCFIGGNIAENSGGPKAVKYGVTKDFVLNLEVVLANGDVIWTGANVLKNATGYNFTQLMVGSEGTLGVVTKAVLQLLPKPKFDKLMLAPFKSGEEACAAVAAIFYAGITPSGLEFMERDAIETAEVFLGDDAIHLEEDINAVLLIEVDGNDEDDLMKDMEAIFNVLAEFDCGEMILAESAAQKESIWKIRRCLGEAVKSISIYKEEDTVVPRAELPALLKGVKEIGNEYSFRSVCYGHAGDGNLHVNILKEDMSDAQWNETLNEAISKIFELCVSLGGTISGEHGIGLVQKPFMPIAFNDALIDAHIKIKQALDPKGILNPGKIIEGI